MLVGVDGESASGKSTFADELAEAVRSSGVPTVRSSIDSFHNPRAVRLSPGMDLAESYLERSHDLDAARSFILEPFRHGRGTYRVAAFDEPSDGRIEVEEHHVEPRSVLIFDGLFLHRPELTTYWDLSVLLVGGDRAQSAAAAGLARHRVAGPEALLHLAWWAALAHRYLDGWRLYVDRHRPESAATFVIDNGDFGKPRIISAAQP